MSIVLSYRAFRAQPLSSDEAAAIDIVIARYQSDFEYYADSFVIHPHNQKVPEIIFSGAISLLTQDSDSCHYWLCCLTDICRILDDAQWRVSLGDVALIWDEDDGWCIPNHSNLIH